MPPSRAARSRPMLSFERSRVLLTDSTSTAATLGIVPLDDLRLVPAPVQGEPLSRRRRRGAVVVSDEVLNDPTAAAELAQLALLGVRFLRPREFYERTQRRVMLDGLDESWFLFERPLRPRRIYEAGKRVIDAICGLLGALLVLLVAPVLWLLYRFDDRGPVFFRQERVGRYGESFVIWKFRTMRVDAEAAGPVWAAKNDARVTRIGALLRKTRLDEMPQFFNVLRGEMSLIGPRPERPVFVRTLGRAIPFYGTTGATSCARGSPAGPRCGSGTATASRTSGGHTNTTFTTSSTAPCCSTSRSSSARSWSSCCGAASERSLDLRVGDAPKTRPSATRPTTPRRFARQRADRPVSPAPIWPYT